MAHTPGPWTMHQWGDNDYEINDAEGTVCNVPGFDDDTVDREKAEPNARLIAAAPELLDRLKSMVSGAECECDTADEEHPLCDICWSRQVIAKAEGRSE